MEHGEMRYHSVDEIRDAPADTPPDLRIETVHEDLEVTPLRAFWTGVGRYALPNGIRGFDRPDLQFSSKLVSRYEDERWKRGRP